MAPVQALPDHPLSDNSAVSIITLKNDNHHLYGITRSFESRRHAKTFNVAMVDSAESPWSGTKISGSIWGVVEGQNSTYDRVFV